MKIRPSVPLALIALCCAVPVLAAPPERTPPQEQPADSGSEVVCRVLKVTGSRLGGRRTCLTRDQWRQQREDHRVETERAQRQKYFTDPAG